MYTEEITRGRKRQRYRVGSGCAAYGHMYQTINQKSKEDIYRFLDAFHPVIPISKIITRKRIDNRSVHREIGLLLGGAVDLDVGVSSKRSRSESRSGVDGLAGWVMSINLLLDYDRVLRLGVRVDIETALTAKVAS